MDELGILLARAQNGDLEAYGEIVRRFQDMAMGYASALLKDTHLAEDVAQEAFVEAYLNLSSVYGAHAFPGWLRKIVFKFCNRLTRKKEVPLVALDAVAEPYSRDKGPAEILDEKDTRDLVQSSLAALPEQERTVVNLFYISEFSQRDVAAFLELPVSTVNFRLHSARKRLKKELIKMTQDNLQSERPSKDPRFTDAVGSNLRAVQKLHEGLLPSLRTLFYKALARDVEVEFHEAHQRMFGFFIQSMERHCCTYFFKMEPLEGWVYFDLSLPLCAAVLQPDADDEAIKRRVGKMLATPIGEEAKIIGKSDVDRLNSYAKDIIAMLVEAWKPVRDITITDAQLETAPPFIFFDSAGDSAIHLVIKVKSSGHEDLKMSLCYLVSTLEPALPDLN